MSWLQNHPFGVSAYFRKSLVLTYAVPADSLRPLLPDCLVPDLFQEHWGFVAIALVDTQHLRPTGFPSWMGRNFLLAGYRIFVRYTHPDGKRKRGLYILRSETNRRSMVRLGNSFTHYRYHLQPLAWKITADQWHIHSTQSDFNVLTTHGDAAAALPEGSPFSNWKEARRFAGPLPFTFTHLPKIPAVLWVEGVRNNWRPTPTTVLEHEVPFWNTLDLPTPQLASAFRVEQVPYSWKKGVTETLPTQL
ncbi:MAG: DUF2071 domain-containing protein [Salibacteraceae bacterium]